MDGIVHLLEDVAGSPWAYIVLFVFSMVDGFLPAVPSESLVITAGVFAASGGPNLFLVILFSGLGAFAGDHISYFLGRRAGDHFARKLEGTSRSSKAMRWAAKALDERGGLVLVVARYIPGGRTAITLTMGAVGYPRRRFSMFDALAASSWAIYSAMIGYIGGAAFEEDPMKGLITGFAVAIAVAGAVEVVRYFKHRSLRRRTPDETPAEVD